MKKIFSLLIFFSFIYLFVHPSVHASSIQNADTIYLGTDKTVNGLYFKTGKNITIDGTINGETYLFGETIIINGKINGDLIAIAKEIDINGNISENTRIIAWKTSLSGNIGKNITIVTMNGYLNKSSVVSGNGFIFSKRLELNGVFHGENQWFAEEIFFRGTALNTTSFSTYNLRLEEQGVFSGDLFYNLPNKFKFNRNQAQKNVTYLGIPRNLTLINHLQENKIVNLLQHRLKIIQLTSYLLIGFILAFLFPKNFTNLSHLIINKPLAALVTGLIYYFFSPFIFILLCFSIIGIPMAVGFIFCFFTFIFVSKIVIALAIGNYLFRDEESKFFPLIVGFIFLEIIEIIPIIGFVTKIISIILGTGGIILSKGGKINK